MTLPAGAFAWSDRDVQASAMVVKTTAGAEEQITQVSCCVTNHAARVLCGERRVRWHYNCQIFRHLQPNIAVNTPDLPLFLLEPEYLASLDLESNI